VKAVKPENLDTPAAASGGVDFLLDGVVNTPQPVPIIDCLRDAHSVPGEELRLLRSQLRTLAQARSVKCVCISSALPGEGKSTIALGLSAALAREAGRRVLLIEADLRRPSVSATLGVPPSAGLAEWLNGGLDRVPLRLVQPGGFRLLVAGIAPLESPDSIGSPLMEALLSSARSAFDFVVLDGPPVLAVSDTILVQDLVDGLLLVARSRQTPREAILDALGRLRQEKVLGVVLNDHREYRHSYQAYAYQRYGMEESGGGAGGPRRKR
jgi:capsular exopolysaccharide synthesis family protein